MSVHPKLSARRRPLGIGAGQTPTQCSFDYFIGEGCPATDQKGWRKSSDQVRSRFKEIAAFLPKFPKFGAVRIVDPEVLESRGDHEFLALLPLLARTIGADVRE
jgi:hypothetical protein